MRIVGSFVAMGLALGLFACSHSDADTAGAQSAQNPSSQTQSSVSCPLAQLSGVSAVEVDIRGGINVTFSAARQDVNDLRRDVHAMKDHNDAQGTAFAACPCAYRESGMQAQGSPGQTDNDGQPSRWNGGAAGNTSMQGSGTVAADAQVDDISTGAILKLTARDKNQVQELRDEIRGEVRSMHDYGCMGAL